MNKRKVNKRRFKIIQRCLLTTFGVGLVIYSICIYSHDRKSSIIAGSCAMIGIIVVYIEFLDRQRWKKRH